VKCSLIKVLFDLLHVEAGKVWLENFIDFSSCQAALFACHSLSAWQQRGPSSIKVLVRHGICRCPAIIIKVVHPAACCRT
jgi:hypothetical protein